MICYLVIRISCVGSWRQPEFFICNLVTSFTSENQLMFLFTKKLFHEWAGIAQSVWRLATDWTARGSNPDGGEIFRTRPDRPWGPPSLLYNGYRVFPGGKAAGALRGPPTFI
jgi:hypothetical protein